MGFGCSDCEARTCLASLLIVLIVVAGCKQYTSESAIQLPSLQWRHPNNQHTETCAMSPNMAQLCGAPASLHGEKGKSSQPHGRSHIISSAVSVVGFQRPRKAMLEHREAANGTVVFGWRIWCFIAVEQSRLDIAAW